MTSKKLFNLLLATCFMLLGVLGGGLYYGDQLLAKQATRIATARADDELVDRKKIIKQSLESKINELSQVNELANKFLPDSKNQDTLLAEFYTIAKNNGVIVTSISFDGGTGTGTNAPSSTSQTKPLQNTKNVLYISFNVQAKAVTYDQLLNFLKAIETNRRKLQVINIGVTPKTDPKDADYGKLSIDELKVEAYLKDTNETTSESTNTTTNSPKAD